MIAFYHCWHRSGSFFRIFFFFLINYRWQSKTVLSVRYYLEFSLSSPRHCSVSQYLSNLIRTTLAPFLFLFVTSVGDSNPGLSLGEHKARWPSSKKETWQSQMNQVGRPWVRFSLPAKFHFLFVIFRLHSECFNRGTKLKQMKSIWRIHGLVVRAIKFGLNPSSFQLFLSLNARCQRKNWELANLKLLDVSTPR